MMEVERRLYRSRNALIGGVCAGIAAYFEADPLAIRVLVVVLSPATGGLAVVAYLALWAVLPKAPERPVPYEIAPQSARSETYGDIDCKQAHRAADDAAAAAAAHMAARGTYQGVGHVPPVPPVGAHISSTSGERALCNTPVAPRFSYAVTDVAEPAKADGNGSAPRPPVPSVAPEPGGSEQGPLVSRVTVSAPACPVTPASNRGTRMALAFGILLLFCGVLALVGTFVMGVAWWQFWPLALVIAGITQMAIPGERGHRASRLSGGFVVFCLGAALLPMSLGALSFETVAVATANLWPLLVVMAGFLVLGGALKSPLFPLLAAVAFAIFCVAALAWFAVPGSTEALTIGTPFGRQYIWDFEVGRSYEATAHSLCAAICLH